MHLLKAEAAREGVKRDGELNKNYEDVCIMSFDLMKTLPISFISTGICYYKRQLWSYRLGIPYMKNNVVHVFL